MEAQALAEADREAEAQVRRDGDLPVLVVAGEGWHPGVVGIVAGRLRERWRRPAVVVGLDAATGVGKGSGRSQAGVNLGRAIQAAYADFLVSRLGLEREAAQAQDVLELDALVAPAAADRALLDAFGRLQPYGAGNPEPLFAAADLRIVHAAEMRGGHVRVEFEGTDGGRLKAVAWRAAEGELGRRLLARDGLVHAAGRLRADDWMSRRGVQLEIEDVADPRQVG